MANEVREIGLEEMLNDPQGVVVIEWPERLGDWVIPDAYQVSLQDDGAENRRVEISQQKRTRQD
jgi:tRNA A37 threonylcarbamoyladenosine biosynthesis protein TsaE